LSDDGKPGDGRSRGEPPEPIVLTIIHDPATGRIDLTGPIGNRLLCYGLLETAKEILLRRGLSDQMDEKRVVVPRGLGKIFRS